ncbi:dephospho-CoA kinase [Ructibacterium gallinarum]|uniref:Dephospho-CoA kinase n=1 Tax=Ructibacterium gallinarum TaxID=2779355 RepID=A0A9D5M1H2_9FIRM|nr:dephospho-CoA kinase [Ructibacterium gallinarum]MBE5039683.1 dephospho-CoA kinase [Ructibacterium gallinarum]
MRILGITGGIGAGKTTVTQMFVRLGADAVDADQISHEIMLPNGSAYFPVVHAFGKNILNADGTIHRKKLADIVFQNEKQLQLLNQITHGCIFEEMQRRIDRSKASLLCLDVPLLFSSDFPIRCDKTLAVIAPENCRIQRVMQRDSCTRKQAEQRICRQLSDTEFTALADFCIVNDGSAEKIWEQVKNVYQIMME